MAKKRSLCLLAVLFALACGSGGCSKVPPFPELHPLSGSVKQEGKTLTTGGLMFVPESGSGGGLTMNATVGADGSFTAQTSRIGSRNEVEVKPGLPAGRYKVIYHPPSDGSKTGLEVEATEIVTVNPGDNKVTIMLPKAAQGSQESPRGD